MIEYSEKSTLAIENFNALAVKSASFWSDDEVSSIRIEIKKHYIRAQKFKCPYCGREYPTTNASVWDAEHVIPKKICPEFMFVAQNLAAACKDCNISKKDVEVRVNPKRKTFPTRSEDYTIVHPHFDILDDHIGSMGPIYYPLSSKGAETIFRCNLGRFTIQQLGSGLGRFADPVLVKIISGLNSATSKIEAKAMVSAIERYIDESTEE
ncbi:HNH endonuclease [Paenarthrobacter sp. NPDC058040]|uniref:HNH endonuclease n=1 Tax=unclassified Paenarthrobacter TaxID=2634190 RepID=UPI0036DB96A6